MVPLPTPELSEQKRALRSQMRGQRLALSRADQRARAEAACARLLSLAELAQVRGRTVAGYAAHRGELDPVPALVGLAARGALIALPRVGEDVPRLSFRYVQPGGELSAGAFGILEPGPFAPEAPAAALAVVVTPGLAFDGEGWRLGAGGGFYDELFGSARPRPLLIGFAYDFQIVDHCPAGENDVPVDLVVTDSRVIRRTRGADPA